jgi:glycosyltransferase involved in cell wall biosynthesis
MTERTGYLPKDKRKKILLLSDDLRVYSGVATMAREIVIQTCHRYNWVQIGATVIPPKAPTIIDVSKDLVEQTGVWDASAQVYPVEGYGTPEILRTVMKREQPDAIMIFTDPRYWGWLFGIESEIRSKVPLVYLNIWDNLPIPLYNKPYYESCDGLFGISKQTHFINKEVLGEKAAGKVIKYIPHGVNDKTFFRITPQHFEAWQELEEFPVYSQEIKKNGYSFVVLYNARNLRRKNTPDLIAAYSQFCATIGKEQARKCLLLMHTDPLDENGTDLFAVREALCDPEYVNIRLFPDEYSPKQMNLLYNCADVVCLPSSNEGWGLSITEGVMSERMVIGTVTGGIQDQMRFVDQAGNWVDSTREVPSNHFKTYTECGEWAIPVFPSTSTLVGSLTTPYIFDDRVSIRDLANAIHTAYLLTPEERRRRGKKGREWMMSSEAKMTGAGMGQNIIDGFEELFSQWVPKKKYEFKKIEKQPRKALTHNLFY